MLFLPEIRLKKAVDNLLNWIRKDLEERILNKEENKSYLYLLFHENKDDDNESNNYLQAKEIFSREEGDSRQLIVRPIFDRQRVTMPTIHIVIPQDIESLVQIGDNEGQQYEDDLNEQIGRGFQTQFSLITTSDNITEVIIINYVLRALLIGSIINLSLIGFINPSFSVQDLNSREEIMPINVYAKGILMNATYMDTFPEVGKVDGVNQVIFDINKVIY